MPGRFTKISAFAILFGVLLFYSSAKLSPSSAAKSENSITSKILLVVTLDIIC
jgi:hypothetical protein